MTGGHSAAGQAMGYLYQCEAALVEMLARAESAPGLVLFMEKLDDLQLEENGSPIEILQLKHHVGEGGDLTETSVDLWRTLNVWMTALGELEPDETCRFALVTTSVAPDGHASSFLRDDEHRDVDSALAMLIDLAGKDGAKATADYRARFAALELDQQRRLVTAIVVRDQAPQLVDLDTRIAETLLWAVRPEHRASFIERLKGWWYARSVELLNHSLRAIAAEDLVAKVHDLRDSFQGDNLPFDFDVPMPSEVEAASYQTRVFVRQLQLIAVSNALISLAIEDYHRAFANSSRWMREGLVLHGELGRYERQLVDEWRHQFEFMVSDLGTTASDDERQVAGTRLLQDVTDSTVVRLRERIHSQVLTRGTYHGLADEQQVGWHPDFVERLAATLEEAS